MTCVSRPGHTDVFVAVDTSSPPMITLENRTARPREVAVSGKNLEGKTSEATLPWQ